MSPLETFQHALRQAASAWGYALTDAQVDLLWRHFERVIETNRRFNLTRITDPAVAACQLYADSLAAIVWADSVEHRVQRVVDIGTGAGFPAVPIAVVRADWEVFALDGTGKKARFVAESAALLGITNLTAIHARAEQWHPPGPIDLVLAKAVGPVADCVRYAARLCRPGTALVIYKTPTVTDEEVEHGASAAAAAGLTPRENFSYMLTTNAGPIHRVLHVFERTSRDSS